MQDFSRSWSPWRGLASLASARSRWRFFVGAVLGPYVLVALPVAVLVGTLTGMSLLFRKKYRLRARTVFMPYMAAGAVMAICFGRLAFRLYASV